MPYAADHPHTFGQVVVYQDPRDGQRVIVPILLCCDPETKQPLPPEQWEPAVVQELRELRELFVRLAALRAGYRGAAS